MNFSDALTWIKHGARAYRTGWYAKNSYIYFVPTGYLNVGSRPLLGPIPAGTMLTQHAHINLMNSDLTISSYSCTQEDLLADDWDLVVERVDCE